MKKKYKIMLISVTVLIVIVSIIGSLKIFLKKEPKAKNVTNVISNINDYGYTLDDRDNKYMKDTFHELESILNKSEVDMEEYAKVLAKLFVIDFYTLNNKINKYDVGSLEYILSDKQEMFKLKAMDTVYKDIMDNTYKDRVQDLPEIENVEIVNIDESTITIEDKKQDCYIVTMKYTYANDLGYDKEGTLYLVKNDTNKLEVVLYNPKIENKNK